MRDQADKGLFSIIKKALLAFKDEVSDIFNLYPPVGKCVYVIRFWFSHEPFLLNSYVVSFPFMEYYLLVNETG